MMGREHQPNQRHSGRPATGSAVSGFTLLEVVLSVSLSVLIVAAISSAVYMNVNVVQRQQIRIEQSYVARNVLMMIASDLRAAIQYSPADVTGLDEIAVSQDLIAGLAMGADMSETDLSQIDTDALMNGMGGGGGGGVGTDAEAPSNSAGASQNIASGQSEILRPGLYGNSTELMIDVSRLPRLDQYDPVVLGTNGPISLPTDIKTTAWFVSQQPLGTDQMQTRDADAILGGLYRRQMDRAVAAFNLDVAGSLAAEGYTQCIAREVVGIEFRYFDGEEFVTEWNSDESGSFPVAIEITVAVDPQRSLRETVNEVLLQEVRAFRSVVYLPIAEVPTEDEAGGAP